MGLRLRWLVAYCCILNVSAFALITVVVSAVASDDDEGDWGDGWPYEYEVPSDSNADLWDKAQFSDSSRESNIGGSKHEPKEPELPAEELFVHEVDQDEAHPIHSSSSPTEYGRPTSESSERISIADTTSSSFDENDGTLLTEKESRIQSKRDARLVQQIIDAAKREDYYAILGMKQRQRFTIPSRTIRVFRTEWSMTTPSLFQTKRHHIEKAKARLANELRNSTDERSQEALDAVQHAASILLNGITQRELQGKSDGRKRLVLPRPLMALAKSTGKLCRFLWPFVVPLGVILLLVV